MTTASEMVPMALSDLPVANMLWVEGRLGPVERACMRSVLRAGHRLVLWHYFPLDGVPEGVELRDGAEVVPQARLFRHQATGSWSAFSNLFRYELLRQGLGLWLDCDCYLVRPIVWDGGLLAGFDSNGQVACGVLGLPADSPLLAPLISCFDAREMPTWLPLRYRLRFTIQRLLRGRFRIEQMPWGNLGPRAVTAMVEKYGLMDQVLPPEVFYPWSWQEAELVFESEDQVTARIGPATVALHLYNQMIRERKNAPAPLGSFLARVQREGA
jgi:Alpha 1,4-glycosyltransferase conserved region